MEKTENWPGKMDPFTENGDWGIYQQQLEQFMLVNLIPDERKTEVLLTVIGSKTYSILHRLCEPCRPSAKPYEELLTILSKQYPSKVTFRKRKDFRMLQQHPEETITDWLGRLKIEASTCNFGNCLSDILKDQFVCGLLDSPVQKRLSKEETSKSLSELVELALSTVEIFEGKSIFLKYLELYGVVSLF